MDSVNKIILLLLCTFGGISFAQQSFAETSDSSKPTIYIKMGEAQTKKGLLAFPPLQFIGVPNASSHFQTIGSDLFRTIQNDLTVSYYFQFINPSAFLEDTAKTTARPFPGDAKGFKFDSWKQISTDFLIRGTFSIAAKEVTLEMYAYYVPKANVVLARKYTANINSIRKMAHIFSNDFLEALTGKKGMFLSKIAVATNRAGGKSKEIYIMDWDGNNPQKITNHKSITLSPTWSPDGSKVAYTAFVERARTKTRNADTFIYEVATGKRWLVSYRKGINSGAAFTPDGKYLFLTLSQNGTPDIYKITLDGDITGKVTNGPNGAMNVEPSVSPDGKKIAFSSDRSGQPMIWIMDIDGKNIKRITFAGKYNSTPAWSPDGKRLAFSGWEVDHFDVFTVSTDGSDMIRITQAKKPNGKWSMNEDPVYSPDGRHLMYTSDRTGNPQIYISNLDGSEERRITTDHFSYYKPKWSVNIE